MYSLVNVCPELPPSTVQPSFNCVVANVPNNGTVKLIIGTGGLDILISFGRLEASILIVFGISEVVLYEAALQHGNTALVHCVGGT